MSCCYLLLLFPFNLQQEYGVRCVECIPGLYNSLDDENCTFTCADGIVKGLHLRLAHEDGKELLEAGEVHPALTGWGAACGGKVQHLQRAQPRNSLLLQDQLHQLQPFCLQVSNSCLGTLQLG